MQHLQVKAAATTTDKGEFSAIAAAYSVDRVKDKIAQGAFAKTIKAWQDSGKNIPLHWDHRGDPHDIIGSVDPKSMRETAEGLFVEGRLDLENSEMAREAWRSMKNNALSLSFGYLATKTRKKGQVTELLEIDLFEISIVPAPANADTRVLSLKSVLEEQQEDEQASAVEDGRDEEPEKAKSAPQDPLVREAWDLILKDHKPSKRPPQVEPEPEPEPLNPRALTSEAWSLALKTRRG